MNGARRPDWKSHVLLRTAYPNASSLSTNTQPCETFDETTLRITTEWSAYRQQYIDTNHRSYLAVHLHRWPQDWVSVWIEESPLSDSDAR